MSPDLNTQKTAFRRALLAWFAAHQRPLPWRENPSLYRTVVSEFMLQQTQVKTVLPYFERWMRELPDFISLAAAPEARVLKLWEGLGYYSRVRNLHRLARLVTALPEPPRTPQAWAEFPGIGPYTAAAITSIAFGAQAACVDGNVVRILTRLTDDAREFRDSATAAKALAPLAADLLSPAHPGDHNQAMMELGATVCLRQNPQCPLCPVAAFCAGRMAGRAEELPRLAARKIEKLSVTRVWCERDGCLLLHRIPAGTRRLGELHELPAAELLGLEAAASFAGAPLAVRKRAITRYRITESIHRAPPPAGRLAPDLVWVALEAIDGLTLSGPHRRWIGEILAARATSERRRV